MAYATPCKCDQPMVFASDPDTCVRCGRGSPSPISASTPAIALAIIEVLHGRRRIGDDRGRDPHSRRSPTPR